MHHSQNYFLLMKAYSEKWSLILLNILFYKQYTLPLGGSDANADGEDEVAASHFFKTDNYRMKPCLLGLLVLFACSGCAQHEEDEDHHLEHLIPAHKPLNFAECVDELKERGIRHFSESTQDAELEELKDIITWLPELAADSDLRRAQWEQVRDIGQKLEALIAGSSESSGQEKWDDHINQLAELVPDSYRPI